MVVIQGQSWTLENLENRLKELVPQRFYVAKDNGKNAITRPSQLLITLRCCISERQSGCITH